jgi:hypothetical protein
MRAGGWRSAAPDARAVQMLLEEMVSPDLDALATAVEASIERRVGAYGGRRPRTQCFLAR